MPAVARSILGDELRFRTIVGRLAASAPGPQEVVRFEQRTRPCSRARSACSPRRAGFPLDAGHRARDVGSRRGVHDGHWSPHHSHGRRDVHGEVIDDTTALGALPIESARPAIVTELREQRRDDAYAAWTIRMQNGAESHLVCERDRLPELGVVNLAAYLPFLSLDEAESARWFAARMSATAQPRACPCRLASPG